MRPLEILLSLANLIAFLVLAVPRLHSLRWTAYAALAALLIALMQGIIEGTRWQMIPAYALAVLLCVTWLLHAIPGGGFSIPRIVSLIITALGVVVLAAAIALPLIMPVFQFAQPRGPYAIGTVTYHWIDKSREEIFTAEPGDHRELMAQVWYPAEPQPNAPRAPYMQDADTVTPHMARLTHFPTFFFSHLRYVTTHAVEAAPVAAAQNSYPVLIYLTGLDGFRQVSMFQVEELVSQGYIVVGIDQPGAMAAVRFPDGRVIPGLTRAELNPLLEQSGTPLETTPELLGTPMPDGVVPYLAQDASFALDQLERLNADDREHLPAGRMDLSRVGMFGISMGAINGAALCAKDARVKACLLMDAFMPRDALGGKLRQPSMWITRPADTMRLERSRSGGWTEKDISETIGTSRAAFEGLPGDGYYVEIPTIFHLNFTDAPQWLSISSLAGLSGPIDTQRAFDIVNAYSVAFFDKHLKGQTAPLLDGPSAQYPEATIETRR